ncbi:MAG: hypothetical protein JW726_16210, partial [Anaerolineales bacterium]|nr:hypothetical protein [Anaerolineales bacterium]
ARALRLAAGAPPAETQPEQPPAAQTLIPTAPAKAAEPPAPKPKPRTLRVWDVMPFTLPCILVAAVLLVGIASLIGIGLRKVLHTATPEAISGPFQPISTIPLPTAPLETSAAHGMPTPESGLFPTAAPAPNYTPAPLPPMPQPETCAAESPAFWHWQIGGEQPNSIFFTDENTGYAVSEPNILLVTTDGGASWQSYYLDAPVPLGAIFFADQETGWVAGNGGFLARTTDGGLTWTQQASGVQADLFTLLFLDASTGWAGGSNGTLLYTTDGGITWRSGATAQQGDVVSISFIDAQHGYIAILVDGGPSNFVLETNDGGASWADTQNWVSVAEDVFAAEGQPVWVAGGWVHGAIWKTLGHGTNTNVVDFVAGSCSSSHFKEILFSDPQHGWAVGDCGLALATSDGGDSWAPIDIPQNVSWITIQQVAAQKLVLAGYGISSGGILSLHSSDGGITWQSAVPDSSAPAQTAPRLAVIDVDFSDAWFGWVVAISQHYSTEESRWLMSTRDGGNTWDAFPLPGSSVSQLVFVDPLRGWAIGAAGLLARTDDGGQTWQIQSLIFSQNWHTLDFFDRQYGWVISAHTGDGACQEYNFTDPGALTLFRTRDEGATWEGPICIPVPGAMVDAYYTYAPNQPLLGMQFLDQNTGYIVGAQGVILKTSDGGLTWTQQTSGVAVNLTALYFHDASTGWAIGESGVLLSTSDGGLTWTQQRLGSETLVDIHFIDAQNGWVAGGPTNNSTLYHTADSGLTWQEMPLDTIAYGELCALTAIDTSHLWLGTGSGLRAYAPACTAASTP